MILPETMPELEARLWSLAGERLLEETVVSVRPYADRATWSSLRALSQVDQPIAQLFEQPWFKDYHARVSRREWHAFAGALLDWAGEDMEDESLRLAVDSLDKLPPASWPVLMPWLRERELVDRLVDPARVVLPFFELPYGASPLAAFPTIRSILDPATTPRPSSAIHRAARAYLAYCAGRREVVRRREELAAQPAPSRRIAIARKRLTALIDSLTPSEPPPPFVVNESRFHFDSDQLRLVLEYFHPSRWGRDRVWVSLFEGDERALASQRDVTPESVHGMAVRVTAEHALDVLIDAEHPLHAEVVAALEQPVWTRMLDALKDIVTASDEARSEDVEEERLVWRIAEDGARVSPAIQRQTRRGWTKGRSVELRQLVDSRVADERDRRVLEAAFGQRSFASPDLGALLQALVGHPRVVLERDPRQGLRVRRAAIEIELRDDEEGQTALGFRAGDLELTPRELLDGYVEADTFVRLLEKRGELVVAPVSSTLLEIAHVCSRFGGLFPRKADATLLELLARLPADVGIAVPPRLRGEVTQPDSRSRVRLEPLPGGGLRAELRVRPLEGGPAHPPGEGPKHIFLNAREGRRYVERDFGLERRLADETIAALHLDHAEPDGRLAWLLDEPEKALSLLEAAQARQERLEWPEGMNGWAIVRGSTSFKVSTKSAKDWFALRGELRVNEEAVSLAALMSAIRAGRRFVELTPGRFARISDEIAGKLSAIDDVAFDEGKELVVAPELASRLRDVLPESELAPDPGFHSMCERLLESSKRPLELPALNAELRGYQREGVEWLLRTASWARGACLADDMGLGKTLQSLALLSARASEGPALVVCPTSVADNWCNEAARFAPGLEVRLHRGADRRAGLEGLGPGHVLVTSYDILVRDAEVLTPIAFATVVFDEAQLLKNPDTQRRKVARSLSAGFSLALSGTPLENHLGELWSIFDVLVPGLLGPWRRFRDRFAAPIERHGDKERLAALRSLLSPFLLRRTKREVAPELPERTEVVRTIELSKAEQALYEAERRRAIEMLTRGPRGGLEAREPAAPRDKRFAVLAALTRLRRLACHPALVDEGSTVRSSKLTELLRLADDLVREEHRALIFSQFTSHLRLVQSALEDAGHEVLYLDGGTPGAERAALVRRFQEGSMPFFLISLKAGGTGLNLTAADTVIHLDPWWNPAVEDQASDRTHRIGQTKPVTVIRLVAQGTIEESVLELHGEKRELARGLLEGAENNARLGTEELLALLGA